jgi:outer membrane lipoprotein SlyB
VNDWDRESQTKTTEKAMKSKAILAVLAVSLASLAGSAQAAGCLKGAAIGAVAGHFVGKGHAVLGAIGGCAVGHHLAAKAKKQHGAVVTH